MTDLPFVYTSPIMSINSGSFPGKPTISTSNTMVASAWIRGLPAELGRPFLPNAKSPYRNENEEGGGGEIRGW